MFFSKRLILLLCLSLIIFSGFSQQVDLFKMQDSANAITTNGHGEPVINTFYSTRLVNSHTVEITGKGSMDFRINHRFAPLNLGFYDMFGLDFASMRLGFDFGIAKDLMVGTSTFFRGVKEVYDTSRTLTPEQQAIARYWDDNPFVIEHAGHMMLGNKKITPGGHWMGIAAIAAKMDKADAVKTAATYALTAVSLYDAFISCWDVKYKTNYIRPITVINQQLDNGWTSFLQTPPFPEYTSGHSTITRAAATILSALYGDHFAFQDTSDLHYIGMQRHFDSFVAAADEASISRFYGGIHYKVSVNEGARAGREVGLLVAGKVKYQ